MCVGKTTKIIGLLSITVFSHLFGAIAATAASNLIVESDGYCLKVAAASVSPQSLIIEEPCASSNDQSFVLNPLAGGVYSIYDQNSGNCLSTDGATAVGSTLKNAACNLSLGQKFTLQANADGSYSLSSAATGNCLAASGQPGSPITQQACSGQGTQNLLFTLPIGALYLFPKEEVSSNAAASYLDAVSNAAWSKFDRVEAYQNPTDPTTFYEVRNILGQISGSQIRPIDYQAQTIGPDGWEEIAWNRPEDIYAKHIVNLSAWISSWGLSIESLHFRSTTPGQRAAVLSSYISQFVNDANASGMAKDIWYTGDWGFFTGLGKTAPLLFTPNLVGSIDRIHWMDLPKLITDHGGIPAYEAQLQTLIQVTGLEKTVVQLGFLDDLSLQDNLMRAWQMVQIAQAMGINQFTVYVKFEDMQSPEFQAFYLSLSK